MGKRANCFYNPLKLHWYIYVLNYAKTIMELVKRRCEDTILALDKHLFCGWNSHFDRVTDFQEKERHLHNQTRDKRKVRGSVGVPAGQRACSAGFSADCGRWPLRCAPARWAAGSHRWFYSGPSGHWWCRTGRAPDPCPCRAQHAQHMLQTQIIRWQLLLLIVRSPTR